LRPAATACASRGRARGDGVRQYRSLWLRRRSPAALRTAASSRGGGVLAGAPVLQRASFFAMRRGAPLASLASLRCLHAGELL